MCAYSRRWIAVRFLVQSNGFIHSLFLLHIDGAALSRLWKYQSVSESSQTGFFRRLLGQSVSFYYTAFWIYLADLPKRPVYSFWRPTPFQNRNPGGMVLCVYGEYFVISFIYKAPCGSRTLFSFSANAPFFMRKDLFPKTMSDIRRQREVPQRFLK